MVDPVNNLGSLVVAFQDVENDLTNLFELLLGAVPKSGAIVASCLSFSKLIDVCDALIREKDLSSILVQEFEELAKEASKLEALRNKYVHSYYDLRDVSRRGVVYERIKRKVRRKRGLLVECETIKDSGILSNITEDMSKLSQNLAVFNEKIFFEVGSEIQIEEYLK